MKRILPLLALLVACGDGKDGRKPYPADPVDGWYGGAVIKQWQWEGEDPMQASQEIAFFPFKCRENVCALSSAWGTRHGDGLVFDEFATDIFFVGVDENGEIYPFHYWYTYETSGEWNTSLGGELRYDIVFYDELGVRKTSYWQTYTFGQQTKYEPPEITE